MHKRPVQTVGKPVTPYGLSMQTKLIVIFLLVKVIPLILLSLIAWHQFTILGDSLREIAVGDATASLNDRAIKNIERLTTDTAQRVADFLYARDSDILYMAHVKPSEENYRAFVNNSRKDLITPRQWTLAPDRASWVPAEQPPREKGGVSTNSENNDMDGFHSLPAVPFDYASVPLYDEITFVDLDGKELVKVVASGSPKRNHPMDPAKKDVSRKENTYVKAETYFPKLKSLRPGEIYVSDVIGAYEGTNYIGMYTPDKVAKAASERGYGIDYAPKDQAYSGMENPVGRRFEGIVRWAAPVTDEGGKIIGYVTLALNHDHIMEFVDHITPMDERYTELPSAYEGNYAFIWDYRCRSIAHPRHHSIVGYYPETGDPQVPWLEASIYDGWQKSGIKKWTDYVKDIPVFQDQSRKKKPSPSLIRDGLVGLDGRYLNFAPQCVGWMDLTNNGGSGSFYILWSGLYKLTTAAAIPYYTGQYAASPANGGSKRGFGFVTIGSGLDYFTQAAQETEVKLVSSIDKNTRETVTRLIVTTFILTVAVILIAILMAYHISRPIKKMAAHLSRLAIGDIVAVEDSPPDKMRSDEIGLLERSLRDLTQSRRDELEMAGALARGDYTRSIPLRSEFDLLGKALNDMIRINKDALAQVSEAVVQVSYGATAVSDVSLSLSQGAQTSETVLGTISETVETVDRQAQDNVEHARVANKLAIDNQVAAQRGYDAVTGFTTAMSEIQQAGKKIATVAKLIDDIAFQTNLLALNASVEAARAGRHGRGFSVVAEEVRNLSSRSAKAAHETGEMVESMLKLIETGAQLAAHSDREFQEIVDTTDKAASLFEKIVDASNAQSQAMSQMVKSLSKIDAVIQENSSNAEQMTSAAGALSRQSEELRQMVSHFRIDSASDGDRRNAVGGIESK